MMTNLTNADDAAKHGLDYEESLSFREGKDLNSVDESFLSNIFLKYLILLNLLFSLQKN